MFTLKSEWQWIDRNKFDGGPCKYLNRPRPIKDPRSASSIQPKRGSNTEVRTEHNQLPLLHVPVISHLSKSKQTIVYIYIYIKFPVERKKIKP
jgi:hypothetical protein